MNQNQSRNINVLIVEPGKAPRSAAIPNTLEAVEAAVGGNAQLGCFLPKRVLLVSRENTHGLKPNRCMPQGHGYISGTFLLCGIPEEGCDFDSLTPGQQQEFQDIFAKPGEFMAVGGTVYADPDNVADAVYNLWDTMRDGEAVTLTKYGGTA